MDEGAEISTQVFRPIFSPTKCVRFNSVVRFAYLFGNEHIFPYVQRGRCVCMHKTHPLGFLSLLMKWLYYVNIMILIIFSLFQHHEAHTFSTLKHTFNLHARKTWALHVKQCYGARIHQPCLHNVEIRSQKQQCQWKRKRNYSSLPEISSKKREIFSPNTFKYHAPISWLRG